ncbi:MAG: hypothetical protein P4L56_00985 [Candidatus Sulfopaludibacter sp.]|nr:hypothetical protein [Candidatus Sulfopaludibacter sp.]
MKLIWAGLRAVCVDLKAGQGGADFFETKVRPVLARQCLARHSSPMGGLRLDTREGMLRG